MEHSRQEFGDDPASQGERLAHDDQGLISRAEKLSQLKGESVDPASLAQREADYNDGKISALRTAIAKEQGKVNTATVAPEITEEAEVDPRLTRYKQQYDGSGNAKLKAVP